MALLERGRAVDLDRCIDHRLGGFRGEELGHRGPPADPVGTGVESLSRRVDEKAGGLQTGGHLRKQVRNRLELADRPAESLSRGRVAHRRVQRGLRHPHHRRADARPKEIEYPHGKPKTLVYLTEHLGTGDEHTIQLEASDRVG